MANRSGMNYDSMDEKLNSASQQVVRSVVKGLPEESMSMAWRSSLNEKLLAEVATKQKRNRVSWFLRPALGLGLACTLAIVVVFHGQGISPKLQAAAGNDGLEAELVDVHRQSSLASDVAGVGLSPVELVAYGSSSSTVSPASSWSETDLDSL